MADLNRGRIALPPLHDEGNAFVIGGGEDAEVVKAWAQRAVLNPARRA